MSSPLRPVATAPVITKPVAPASPFAPAAPSPFVASPFTAASPFTPSPFTPSPFAASPFAGSPPVRRPPRRGPSSFAPNRPPGRRIQHHYVVLPNRPPQQPAGRRAGWFFLPVSYICRAFEWDPWEANWQVGCFENWAEVAEADWQLELAWGDPDDGESASDGVDVWRDDAGYGPGVDPFLGDQLGDLGTWLSVLPHLRETRARLRDDIDALMDLRVSTRAMAWAMEGTGHELVSGSLREQFEAAAADDPDVLELLVDHCMVSYPADLGQDDLVEIHREIDSQEACLPPPNALTTLAFDPVDYPGVTAAQQCLAVTGYSVCTQMRYRAELVEEHPFVTGWIEATVVPADSEGKPLSR